MKKNLLWAFLSAVPIAFGLVAAEVGIGAKYGVHCCSFEEGPKLFILYMVVFSGLVVFFLYRAVTRSD